MGIFLYHGTSKKSANNIKKHGVDLSYSRKNLDFGAGFYLTSNKGQAKNWAYRNGHNNAVVIIFEADLFIVEISNDIGTQIVFKTNRALTQQKYVDKEVLK